MWISKKEWYELVNRIAVLEREVRNQESKIGTIDSALSKPILPKREITGCGGYSEIVRW